MDWMSGSERVVGTRPVGKSGESKRYEERSVLTVRSLVAYENTEKMM